MAKEKRLLTGVKPTGGLHIGNYFGAIKQFVDLTNGGGYDCALMVADYHALNIVQDAAKMRQYIYNLVVTYLAVGLDYEKVAIFKQSDVPEHTELAWIFNTITPVTYLQRAHAYKDALSGKKEISVGTFDYPMLMAADILLYDIDVVPVGQDQKQHIEYAREAARKFNLLFNGEKGTFFVPPEEYILEAEGVIPGTDGRKMSKSYENTIPLFASRDEIASRVMSIVTDSSGERPENVYAIHRLFRSEEELGPFYEAHRGKYKELKESLVEDVDSFISPLREKRKVILEDEGVVRDALENGRKRMRRRARKKMKMVRSMIGVSQ